MAAGEGRRPRSMRSERVRMWLQRGALLLSLVLFTVQAGSNLWLWLQGPTMASYSVSDDLPLPLPALTVCPQPPFSVDALLTLGLNMSASTPKELRLLYEQQSGVVADSPTVWSRAAWPLGAVVQYLEVAGATYHYPPWQTISPEWNISYTPLGPCFTLAPAATLDPSFGVTLTLRHPLKPCVWKTPINGKKKFSSTTSCEKVNQNCNTSCIWEKFVLSMTKQLEYLGTNVIMHPVDEPPTLAVLEAVVPLAWINSGEKYTVEVLVEPSRVHRMDRAEAPCNSSSGYSEAACRQRCAEPCHPRLQGRRPPHPTWTSPSTHIACFTAPGPETFVYENLSEKQYACWRQCRPRCSETIFSYKLNFYNELKDNFDSVYTLTVRPKSRIMSTITETKVITVRNTSH